MDYTILRTNKQMLCIKNWETYEFRFLSIYTHNLPLYTVKIRLCITSGGCAPPPRLGMWLLLLQHWVRWYKRCVGSFLNACFAHQILSTPPGNVITRVNKLIYQANYCTLITDITVPAYTGSDLPALPSPKAATALILGSESAVRSHSEHITDGV